MGIFRRRQRVVDESQVGDEGAVDESAEESPANGDTASSGELPEVVALRAEAADYKDKYLRTLAEFDNARKRFAKERGDLLRYQGESIVVDFLEAVDDLERAVEFAETDPTQLAAGVKGILKKLHGVMEKWEIRGDSGLNSPFDPVRFMAISQTPVAGVEPGTIVNVLKKAYSYKDKLIRVGEVVVAAPPNG